jgi:small multidrug resistance family-3 protein
LGPSWSDTVVVVFGVVSLVGFPLALAGVDSAFAGRAYAVYVGFGFYIAASLIWLWLVEGQSPTRTDLLGAALAFARAVVIIGFAAR